MKCQMILSNKMQCPREAKIRKIDDLTGREAMCTVCFALNGHPPEYNTKIEEE